MALWKEKSLPTVTYVLHSDVQQQLGHHGDDRQYEESSQRVNGPHWRERERGGMRGHLSRHQKSNHGDDIELRRGRRVFAGEKKKRIFQALLKIMRKIFMHQTTGDTSVVSRWRKTSESPWRRLARSLEAIISCPLKRGLIVFSQESQSNFLQLPKLWVTDCHRRKKKPKKKQAHHVDLIKCTIIENHPRLKLPQASH